MTPMMIANTLCSILVMVSVVIRKALGSYERHIAERHIWQTLCWNSALCYHVFLNLLVDGLKRFSVLAPT